MKCVIISLQKLSILEMIGALKTKFSVQSFAIKFKNLIIRFFTSNTGLGSKFASFYPK